MSATDPTAGEREACIAPPGNLCTDTGCWDADRCVVAPAELDAGDVEASSESPLRDECKQCEADVRLEAEWRTAWSDGEAEGQRGVIRQVAEAVAHLDPPDTGMGVFDLVEWALDAVRRKAGDERAERIAQAIEGAKPFHPTRNYTPVDAAYDDAARIARESR